MSAAPLPALDRATVLVPAPGDGQGNWTGAPSVVLHDGTYVLAYRVRRPLTEGRGVAVVVATSTDGEHVTEVVTIPRDTFGAESLERPALVRLDDAWRIYLSCATPGSKHWWVEAVTAPTLEGLADGERQVVFAGDDQVGVKDPVIVRDTDPDTGAERWRCWLCCHPLDVPGAEDRMTTSLLTSRDGLTWDDQGTVLTGREGWWDARGARVTAWLGDEPLTLTYDGRPDAESNWHETTGLVTADTDGTLVRDDDWRRVSPHSDGAFRYACAVPLPGGRTRWFAEMAREDGAHDLVTMVV